MEFYTISLPDVTPLKLVTAKAAYGIGLLTAFVSGLCSLFGMPNDMYTDKLKKAEAFAMEDLEKDAKSIGADGVMDIHCQIDGLSFFVFGTAYKWSDEEKARRQAEQIAKPETKERAGSVVKGKATSQNISKTILTNTDDMPQNNQEQSVEQQKILPCSYCGEDLAFMGWDDNDLNEMQICPLCGKEILLKQ